MPTEKNADDLSPLQRRVQIITLRLDEELYDALNKRAGKFGLSPILRTLIRAYVRGDVVLSAEDLVREMAVAQRGRKPEKRKPKT